MGQVGVAASIVIGVLFVVAGASKLAIGPAWPEQARDFGAPRSAALAVPWIELAIGAALVAQLARPVPAIAAIAVLLLFSALIARLLLAGRAPSCACFGAWSAKPIGLGHLARNGAFLVVAVLAMWA